jgi:cell division protein FtsZ
VAPEDLPLEMAFRLADDVLRQGIQGISELITLPGLINIDFAHIRNLMLSGGGAYLAIGTAEGEEKAHKAIENALHHPMLDAINLEQASGILVNFTGGSDLAFMEVMDAINTLRQKTGDQVDIIPGVISDERMQDRAQVIMIVTGIGAVSVDIHSPRIIAPQPVSQPGSPIMLNIPQPVITKLSQEEYSRNLDIPAFLRRRIQIQGS